jgi:CRISPR-associated protein Cmr2
VSWLLDLSIGPVQSFVGEARRTRDLWGGSYLLSYLSAHAAAGAAAAGGNVHVVDSPLYVAVRDGATGGEAPHFGTVPNHFQVTVDGDPRLVATRAEQRLRSAWQRLCDAVWAKYVARLEAGGDGTRDIWDRQVGGYWQVTWVAGDGNVRGLLQRRKHWRNHCPPDEPGDKCSVMPAFQELSGYVRTHGRQAREAQVSFWNPLQNRVGRFELREHERLCALALIKRLFPVIAQSALGWEVDVENWPSTVWIGALPWLHGMQKADPEAADRYAGEVTTAANQARRKLPDRLAVLAPAGRLARLDANFLHRGFVADPRLCPLPEVEQGRDAPARAELRERLTDLYRSCTGTAERSMVVGGPPVYYAVLRADGDKLGDLAAELGREQVGQALDVFGRGVAELITAHRGVPVYSGGDDVLAMLPMADALRCAAALALCYREAFQRFGRDGAHLSAAVLFAHVRLPLATALADSMRLLEEVAKEGNDRDSLAVGVLKPGSRHCEWVSHWQRPSPDGRAAQAEAVALLDRLVQQLRPDGAEPGLSSSVLYRVREALSLLCGWPRWEPGRTEALPAGVDAKAYLRAEIGQSLAAHLRLTGDQEPEEELRRRVETLVSSIWPLLRHPAAGEGERIGLDALLLARFLAGGGHEEEHG